MSEVFSAEPTQLVELDIQEISLLFQLIGQALNQATEKPPPTWAIDLYKKLERAGNILVKAKKK